MTIGRDEHGQPITVTEGALWTIPAGRMKKGKRAHRVPLSEAALDVLREALLLRVSDHPAALVFLGQDRTSPLSDMTMLALLRRMGHADLTVHGFRSSFRDWVAEATSTPAIWRKPPWPTSTATRPKPPTSVVIAWSRAGG